MNRYQSNLLAAATFVVAAYVIINLLNPATAQAGPFDSFPSDEPAPADDRPTDTGRDTGRDDSDRPSPKEDDGCPSWKPDFLCKAEESQEKADGILDKVSHGISILWQLFKLILALTFTLLGGYQVASRIWTSVREEEPYGGQKAVLFFGALVLIWVVLLISIVIGVIAGLILIGSNFILGDGGGGRRRHGRRRNNGRNRNGGRNRRRRNRDDDDEEEDDE